MDRPIKSYYYTDREILTAISKLYLSDAWFDLDPTFSKGTIYKGTQKPRIKADIDPAAPGTIAADVLNLPIADNAIGSALFDPPFLWGIKNMQKNNHNNNQTAKRFSMFRDYNALAEFYKAALAEFHRVLKRRGILVFKCMDRTCDKTTITHCLVNKWAIDKGFEPMDLFIRLVNSRLWNPKKKQRHSRKFHSYYFVFKKPYHYRRAIRPG